MSSNAINDVNTTTTPPTLTQNNQNDIYDQKQDQSTVPKTTGLIDDIKISTVLPNSIDNIGESYTFYQKPNDSMATTFNITNDENLATNNIQNIKTVGKGKENDSETGLNNDNSNSVDGNQASATVPPSSYPEIPLTANTKKKRSRNPSKIPRPQNCFIIYRREKHQIISAENPGIANNDISKIIAKMWREEPPEVKEIYHQRAKEEAKRHMLANPGYKYTPRASKNRRKRKLNDENKKFEENHPLKHEFDNPPHQGKNHENIRHWIDNISSPSQEQNIINTLAQGTQNINSYSMVNPLQTSFEDPLYSSSNSGSLAYSAAATRYIKDQYATYLRKELTPNRERRIADTRIHAVLYFIAPSGHSLKPIDIIVLKKLSDICNVIPVIAKSDSLTIEERIAFKKRIREELAFHDIKLYPYDDVDVDDYSVTEADRAEKALNQEMRVCFFFLYLFINIYISICYSIY